VNQNGSIVTLSGEWLQIQSSVPVVMQNFYFGTQYNVPGDLPKTYTIVGSNDGSTWYDLQDGNFTAWPGNLAASNTSVGQTTFVYAVSTATTTTVNNNSITSYPAKTNAYTYFRLIIKSICNGQFSVGASGGYARGFWNPTFSSSSSSAVSLALDTAVPNQLNIGGSLGIAGGITPLYSTPSFGPGQIGYTVTSNSSLVQVSNTDLYSVTPVAGVYIFNMDFTLNSPNAIGGYITNIYLTKSGVTYASVYKSWGGLTTGNYTDAPASLTGFVPVNGSQIVKFTLYSSNSVNISWYVKYIRIA
jgi:hypothetical protein